MKIPCDAIMWGLAISIVLIIVCCCMYHGAEGFADDSVVARPRRTRMSNVRAAQVGKNSIVVGLHYVDWCGYCKRMRPVWDKVRDELSGPEYSGITFVENNEDLRPTPGVVGYPTIIRMRNGKAEQYAGRADGEQLKDFILNAAV